MNINDFEPRKYESEEALWEDAYRVSCLLAEREPKVCITHDEKVSINCPYCQAHIKDLAYRIFEELCESAEPGQEHHSHEELADAAIFLNYLLHRVGMTLYYEDEGVILVSSYNFFSDFLISLGLMTNILKLRPWRKQFTFTDEGVFKDRINTVITSFKDLCRVKCGWDVLLKTVNLKVQVNEFRVRSNY